MIRCLQLAIMLWCSTTLMAQITLVDKSMTTLLKPLQIGDTVPDINMGDFMNNPGGKTRFSDYSGKLLILINWNTYCGSCIASFPKYEALQQTFGDSIQIILTNPKENEAQIKARLLKMRIKLPNVPIIYMDTIVQHLFPSKYLSSAAWIDSKGVVKLVDGFSDFVNNPEKIRQALSGQPFTYFRHPLYAYDPSLSLKDLEAKDDNFAPLFSGAVYPFHPTYGGAGGYATVVDSLSGTSRVTFVNENIIRLYMAAYKDLFDVYKSIRIDGHRDWEFNYEVIKLSVKDTLRYTADFHQNISGDTYIRSSFCYEQVVLLDTPEKERLAMMRNELDRYFGRMYGVRTRVVTEVVPCYLLVQTSNAKVGKNSMRRSAPMHALRNNAKMKTFSNWLLKNIISGYTAQVEDFKHSKPFIFDASDYHERLEEMVLPDYKEVRSLDSLNKALAPYNLSLVQGTKSIRMLLIEDKE